MKGMSRLDIKFADVILYAINSTYNTKTMTKSGIQSGDNIAKQTNTNNTTKLYAVTKYFS